MTLSNLAETTLTLAGGWLPGSSRPDYFPLGGDHVDRHQLEMLRALERGDRTLLNTNATGAGKTLSWAAPVIRSHDSSTPQLVLATYPTTALIEDQRSTLLQYFRDYYDTSEEPWAKERSFDLVTTTETGTDDREVEVLKKGDKIFKLENRVQTISATADPSTSTTQQLLEAEKQANDAVSAGLPTILLTTPDTFTNLSTDRFRNNDVKRVVGGLDAIVVDEFHLATDRARRLLPFHLDVHRSLSGRYLDTFVFLSATPEPSYVERIDRSFEPTRVVDNINNEPSNDGSTRQILPEIRLGVTNRPQFRNGEWIADNVATLAEAHEPPGQMLVIVDSVREVEAVTNAFEAETSLSTGRVYGWKKEGRAEAIENSEVIVGNTAVEVGVDFEKVNRLVFTGYEASSILQRIGRMRYRSQFEDYRALLITQSDVQADIMDEATAGRVTRQEFDRVVHNAINMRTERPYYDVLCGAYTHYLWNGSENPLRELFIDRTSEFSAISHDHFGTDFENIFDESLTRTAFWDAAGRVVEHSPSRHIFSELHDYRSSQFSCVVIDTNDEDEPLKSYSLNHVLKHREGAIIGLDEIPDRFKKYHERSLSRDERAFLEQSRKYSVCGFVTTGTCDISRGYYIDDFQFEYAMRDLVNDGSVHRAIKTLPDPDVKTDPPVDGLEKIDLGDEDILVQFSPHSPTDTRQRFGLGPYASVVPTSQGETLVLGDDAIKVHAQLTAERGRT